MPANSKSREKELHGCFDEIVKKHLQENSFERSNIGTIIGMETELFLTQANLEPLDYRDRDGFIIELNQHAPMLKNGFKPFKEELGGSQIEITTLPINISNDGISTLVEHAQLLENLLISGCVSHAYRILRIGGHPLVVPTKHQSTKSREKYLIVPGFHNQNRTRSAKNGSISFGKKETIDISDAAVVGLCNAIQINIDAYSFTHAIDLLNRSFMISPYVVALCSNARYFGKADTGVEDARFMIWQMSHDTRSEEELKTGLPTRVGLPNSYHSNMASYLADLRAYPFILDTDLDPNLDDMVKVQEFLSKTVGLNWRDARIKFLINQDERKLLVEFRPVSTQFSLMDDFAAMMFYLGRLHFSTIYQEDLLPMPLVLQNKQAAMLEGMNGYLWHRDYAGNILQEPARIVLEAELERAILGLHSMDGQTVCDDQLIEEFISILNHNLELSPSQRFHARVAFHLAESTQNPNEAIIIACRELNLFQPLQQ